MAREITYEIDMLVDASHLAASGGVSLASPVSVTSQLQAEVRLDDWQAYLPVATTGDLQINQQLAFSQGDEMRLDIMGSAQLDEFELEGALPVAVRRLTWNGKSQLSVVAGGTAEGASGGASGSPPETLPRVTAEGVLGLTDVAVEPFGSIKQLSIENVLLGEGLVTAQGVQVSGLNVTLQRLADGSIEGLPTESKDDETIRQAPMASTVEEVGSKTAETPALLWLVDTLNVDGQLLFSDASVEPSVALRLQDIDLKVSQIGPGQESAFNLQATHQEAHQTGGLTLQGKGFLLDDPLNAEMVLALSGFEVHQLSAYLGNGVRSGRMAIDADVNIKQGKVKATNRIRIDGLKVEAGLARERQRAGLPLSIALDLLKDGDDHINLTVPIEGDLQGLAVDTSDIINTALLNAARKAAFTYVQQALQPWGALMLLKNVAKVASRPRFIPVEFTPGSSDLDSEPQRYVTQIATLMKRRPALTVTLCGVATQTDRQSLNVGPSIAELTAGSLQTTPVEEAAESTSDDVVQDDAVPEPVLLALAIDRGARVTNQLVESGISVERLFACGPSYVADDSSPRVEISL
jgi:outer membrane protein OmpA-like peptidoglycan-associated protein